MTTESISDENFTNQNTNNSYDRCENRECNAFKLLYTVPKRKSSQFITEPIIKEKPLMVDGFTVAFQVDGNAAKWNYFNNTTNETSPKTIYRIVPNTHVHVVNYVVVDKDDVNFHNLQKHEPHTMQKLLSSQKASAEQMLKKLMMAQGITGTLCPISTVAPSNINMGQASVNTTTTMAINQASPMATVSNNSVPVSLPVRVHPNLKITAVVSAESVNRLKTTPSSVATEPSESGASSVSLPPYITAVPLANLQNPKPSTSALDAHGQPVPSHVASTEPIPSSSSATSLNKPVFDKMQAEIQELRRKVALLAEAHAQNQRTTIAQSAAKRPRNTSTPK